MCWAASDEGPLFWGATKALEGFSDQLRSYFYGPETEIAEVLCDGCTDVERQAASPIQESWWRNGDDVLHTRSGFIKDRRPKITLKWHKTAPGKELGRSLRLIPVGLRAKRKRCLEFLCFVSSCWRVTLAVQPALTANSHGAPIKIPQEINTGRWWLSIGDVEGMECWDLQHSIPSTSVIHYFWKLLFPLLWVYFSSGLFIYQCFQWKCFECSSVFLIKYVEIYFSPAPTLALPALETLPLFPRAHMDLDYPGYSFMYVSN